MPKRSSKRPRDLNALASEIVREATGDERPKSQESEKNPAAVELGRRGGLKGGKVAAAKLTPEERSERARRMVAARWAKYRADRASI